jgi:hypothetical protein
MTSRDEQHDAGRVWETPCPRCRYDTRGLAAERCPECGLGRDQAYSLLRAQQTMATSVPRALGVALLTSFTGISGLALLNMVVEADQWLTMGNPERLRTLAIAALCFAQIGAAVVAWSNLLRHRRLAGLLLLSTALLIALLLLAS